MQYPLGFIGGGVMAEAILSRLVAQGAFAPQQILVSDPLLQRRATLAERYGIQVTERNSTVLESVATLILAVKPQTLTAIAGELNSTGSQAQIPLVVSILAGVPLSRLEQVFPKAAVVRAMPNTPATVGAGVTAIALGQHVTPAQRQQAIEILQAIGLVLEVPESQMDAVTGLSGSGPGYLAVIIEALTDGGVAVGLPRAIASQLALETVWGTAQLLKQSQLHPAQLKDQVTSPGGTTIAGIAALEAAGLRSALIKAVQAAAARSQELGN